MKFVKMLLPKSRPSGPAYRNYDENPYVEVKGPMTQEMVGLKAKMDANSPYGNTCICPP